MTDPGRYLPRRVARLSSLRSLQASVSLTSDTSTVYFQCRSVVVVVGDGAQGPFSLPDNSKGLLRQGRRQRVNATGRRS